MKNSPQVSLYVILPEVILGGLNHTHSFLQSFFGNSFILSLLRNNSTDIHKYCQFAIFTHSVQPNILVLDSKHVMLTNVKHVFINCSADGSRNVTCLETCRVMVSCGCSLESDSIYLPGRIKNCHFKRRGRKVFHAVNLAFLHNFFEASQLADLSETSLLESSLKIITPKLKILEANYSHELKVDKRARLDLAKLANLTKQDVQAYPSLAHLMIDSWRDYFSGFYDWSFSLVSWRSWILVILGLLAGASFGISIILSYRLRILAATVTTLSLPRHSHALPTILNYFPSTTPTVET